MNKKVILVLALALVLAAGGIAIASNMAYKLNKSFTLSGSDGINTISLPYFQSQFTNAQSYHTDAGLTDGVERIFRINSNNTVDSWLGTSGLNFVIVKGAGYGIEVTGAKTQIVVGSHDPTFGVTLVGGVTNFISLPFHMAYAKAQDLRKDIPNQTPGVERVVRINSNNTRDSWLGSSGLNFPLVIGRAYIIDQLPLTETLVPDHY